MLIFCFWITGIQRDVFWGRQQTFFHSVSGYKHKLALKYKRCRPEASCWVGDSLFEGEVMQHLAGRCRINILLFHAAFIKCWCWHVNVFRTNACWRKEERRSVYLQEAHGDWMWSTDGGGGFTVARRALWQGWRCWICLHGNTRFVRVVWVHQEPQISHNEIVTMKLLSGDPRLSYM